MELPESSIVEKPLTKEGLNRFLNELDWYDRQDTLEAIHALADKTHGSHDLSVLKEALYNIRLMCDEFVSRN